MIATAEVFLWGSRIGIIHLPEGRDYVSFEYDRSFVQSNIELAPLKMPLSTRVYEFPELRGAAFHGVPGLIADSLPDKFGNAIINQWLALQGKNENDFNVLDRLCYTGARGMGALEYVPATGPDFKKTEAVDVAALVEFASDILQRKQQLCYDRGSLAYSQLLQLGTSAGGARAKAVIAWNESTGEVRSGQINAGDGFDYWLMKFDGVSGNGDHQLEDKPEYTLVEYAYYLLAVKAGLTMQECRLYEENGRHHFLTKRFDRVEGKKVHMQTLGGLAHLDYNIPGLCGYEQAANYMRRIGLGSGEVEQFFRRMVFNVLAVNQDDHVKNISFIMDKTGTWRLSPAYDITFAYAPQNRWLAAHQMTVNGKKNNISRDDMLACGAAMDISRPRLKRIMAEVAEAVKGWEDLASEVGIREKTINYVSGILDMQKAW